MFWLKQNFILTVKSFHSSRKTKVAIKFPKKKLFFLPKIGLALKELIAAPVCFAVVIIYQYLMFFG